jgi:hypothetical protein
MTNIGHFSLLIVESSISCLSVVTRWLALRAVYMKCTWYRTVFVLVNWFRMFLHCLSVRTSLWGELIEFVLRRRLYVLGITHIFSVFILEIKSGVCIYVYGKLTIKLEIRIIPCAVICRPMICNNINIFCCGYFNSTFCIKAFGIEIGLWCLGVRIAELE